MTRVLIVGLGNMGRAHALAHHHHQDAEIVGLVIRSDPALPGELQGYPRFRRLEDGLKTRPGLVVIATYAAAMPILPSRRCASALPPTRASGRGNLSRCRA